MPCALNRLPETFLLYRFLIERIGEWCMEIQELLFTAVRSVALYAIMLVVIRLLGKRTVGNFSAFDLLVALMLGEVVDEIIYGDVNFFQGTTAILVIAGAKYLTSYLAYTSDALNKILDGIPRILIRNGNVQNEGLKHELINPKELLAALRLHGISDMREVKLATMEVDGLISVLKEEWAENLQKIDLQKPDEQDEVEVPHEKRTDTMEALGTK
jgi:uncharacterized membrane protein YcaP (DUF421 family)